jgi:hypothetical protein
MQAYIGQLCTSGGGGTIVVDYFASKSGVGGVLTQPLQDVKEEVPPHVVPSTQVEWWVNI